MYCEFDCKKHKVKKKKEETNEETVIINMWILNEKKTNIRFKKIIYNKFNERK